MKTNFIIGIVLLFVGCGDSGDDRRMHKVFETAYHTSVGDVDASTVCIDTTVSQAHRRLVCASASEFFHRIRIVDADGKSVADFDRNCTVVAFEAGRYRIEIDNGDPALRRHAIFFSHDKNATMLEALSVSKASYVRGLSGDITAGELAKTTIAFDNCPGCNLDGVDLSRRSFGSESMLRRRLDSVDDGYFEHMHTDKDAFFQSYDSNIIASYRRPLDLRGASLQGANLAWSVFYRSDFSGVNLTEANLSHTIFIDCRFDGALFERTDASGALFIRASFEPTSTLVTTVVSRPDVMSDGLQTCYGALLSNGTIGLHCNVAGGRQTLSSMAPPPGGLASAPVLLPNYFNGALASEGVFSVFGVNLQGDLYVTDRGVRSWVKLPMNNPGGESITCLSAPSATYWKKRNNAFSYLFGMRCMEIYQKVTCKTSGNINTWTRMVSNCSDTAVPYAWRIDEFSNTRRSRGTIALNTVTSGPTMNPGPDGVWHGTALINIDDGKMGVFTPHSGLFASAHQFGGPLGVAFVSVPDRTDSSDFIIIALSDGNIYAASDSVRVPYDSWGHPSVGIASGPVAIDEDHSKTVVAVRGGDGHVWTKEAGGAWEQISMPVGRYGVSLAVHKSDFTDAYIELSPDYVTKGSRMTKSRGSTESDRIERQIAANENRIVGSYFRKMDFSSFHWSTDLNDTVFSACNLHGAIFDAMALSKTAFVEATVLTDASFKNTHWVNGSFSGVTLQHTDLSSDSNETLKMRWRNVTVDNVRLDRRDLSALDFTAVDFKMGASSFVDTSNVPLSLIYGVADVEGADASKLREYNLTGATFDRLAKLDFTQADLHGAQMERINFSGSADKLLDMNGSNWSGARLRNAQFRYCRVSHAEFDGAVDAKNTRFVHTDMQQAKLRGNFQSALFDHCDMSGVVADSAQMNLAKFFSVTTHRGELGTHFSQANLTAATFNAIEMRGTDFSEATMDSASIIGSTLIESNFKKITLNNTMIISDTAFDGCCFDSVAYQYISDNNVTYTRSGTASITIEIFGTLMPQAYRYRLDSGCEYYQPMIIKEQ